MRPPTAVPLCVLLCWYMDGTYFGVGRSDGSPARTLVGWMRSTRQPVRGDARSPQRTSSPHYGGDQATGHGFPTLLSGLVSPCAAGALRRRLLRTLLRARRCARPARDQQHRHRCARLVLMVGRHTAQRARRRRRVGMWRDWYRTMHPRVRVRSVDVSSHACERYGHELRDIATWRPNRQ